MTDPPIISLDIESYGAVLRDRRGNLLPKQHVFHPARAELQDGCPKEQLIQTVGVTVPTEDPREGNVWSLDAVGRLSPGHTFVFRWDVPQEQAHLRSWILHADTIIGMNLLFDDAFLQYFKSIDLSDKTLLDLAYVKYLHNEMASEKTLKALGPILGLYAYTDTLDTFTAKNADEKKLHTYNGQDTHNTILAVAELARRIRTDYPGTDKLSAASIQHFSDTTKLCVSMALSGVPMSRSYVEAHRVSCDARSLAAVTELAGGGLNIGGKGSVKSKLRFFRAALKYINKYAPVCDIIGVQQVQDHSLFELTKVKKEISTGEPNRLLMLQLLDSMEPAPGRDKLKRVLEVWKDWAVASGEASKYCAALLTKKSSPQVKHPYDSLLLPQPGDPRCKSFTKSQATLCSLPLVEGPSSGSSLFDGSESSTTTSTKGSKRKKKVKLDSVASSQKPSPPPPLPLWSSPTHNLNLLLNLDVQLTYPQWYAVPSAMKDGQGGEGGQRQGRINCRNPNVQQFNKTIKKAIQSRYKDGVIIEMDLSQAELRTAAILSGCPTLVEAFEQNLDLHTQRAMSVFKTMPYTDEALDKWLHNDHDYMATEYEDFSNSYRQPAKHANFTDLNLGGADVLQRTILKKSSLLIPLSVCALIVSTRAQSRPGLHRWQQEVIEEANRQGYLDVPITGHSHYFRTGTAGNKPNEMVNFKIQTLAAVALLKIAQHMWQNYITKHDGAHIFNLTYDALYLDVKREQIDAVVDAIDTAVEECVTTGYWRQIADHYGNYVPLLYETKVKYAHNAA